MIDVVQKLRDLEYLCEPDDGPCPPQTLLPGPLPRGVDDADAVDRAIDAYASFHAIPATIGSLRAHMGRPRCGRPDRTERPRGVMEAGQLGQFPRGHHIRVLVRDLAFPGLALARTRAVWERALQSWCGVCGVLFDLDFVGTANIAPAVGKVDGKWSVLAWSEMPQSLLSPDDTMEQRYDRAEDWADESFAQSVIAHEVGHALGLDHIAGTDTALMNPTIGSIVVPNARDAAGAVLRYGASPTQPPPEPEPNEILLAAGVGVAGGTYDFVLRRRPR
jgi:hypothetical protein